MSSCFMAVDEREANIIISIVPIIVTILTATSFFSYCVNWKKIIKMLRTELYMLTLSKG